MKIIGAGLPRTGTLSTRVALEQLGLAPCYHMMELFANLDHGPRWQAAVDGGPADWRSLFAGYLATVDMPGCVYWRELSEAYPDAKVLLTVRDPDRWYDSFTNLRTLMTGLLMEELPEAGAVLQSMPFMVHMLAEGAFAFQPDRESYEAKRDEAIAAYHAHVDQVRREVPADRLLVFDVREGWEPLCAFLQVDVPAEPFPHLNEGDTVVEVAREALGRSLSAG